MNPLNLKCQKGGRMRLQGVFTLRDQEGFPIDMAYEMAKEHGWEVDWVEAMADAARQCPFKYEALCDEIKLLEPDKFAAAFMVFSDGLLGCYGETFCEKAEQLYRKMRPALTTPVSLTQVP